MSGPQSGEETTQVAQSTERPPAQPESSPWPSPALPGPGQVLAGRYTVLQLMGQGGMGVVLAAYDARLDRRVALKLLHPQRAESEALRTRLLREAQAMARLSHPSVVQVYDAGELEDGRLFIAMEYVEGSTLRQWSQARPCTWREVLQAYLEAGRGLAAAHAVGLVHRDFKPDNVLVGAEGRVRVTDFGVARGEALGSPALLTPQPLEPSTWEQALTQPGMVVGTLRYLAPELLLGQPAEARSDLFAFCVALYEALYQQPPYGGGDLEARAAAFAASSGPAAAPPGSEVPAWVEQTLRWGLRVQPEQRPSSMQQLLEALEADPRVRRRQRLRLAGLGTLVAGLVALAASGWLGRQEQDCAHPERRLVGVWDEATRRRLEQVLLGTGLAYAPDTYQRVAQELESYAGRWAGLQRQVCEAAQGKSALPTELVVLRGACLERRRGQLGALTTLLADAPDKELLAKAIQAVQALPPLEECTEDKALLAAVPPPREPALRARVEALQAQVDRLEAHHAAGKYSQGLALADTLLPQVAEVRYAPLHARALFQVARLKERAGEYAAAEALLRQAMPLAAEAREDMLVANAWGLLVTLIGSSQSRPQEALGLLLPLEMAAARVGSEEAQAMALSSHSTVLRLLGQYEQAQALLERALALRQKALPPGHLSLAATLNSLATLLMDNGKYEQALGLHERALALRQKALGPEHPEVATTLSNIGNTLTRLGRYQEALSLQERALALRHKSLGPEHPDVASSLSILGIALMHLGRYEECCQHHERALALRQQALGPRHALVATSLSNLAICLMKLGQHEQARQRYEQALSLRQEVVGPEHPEMSQYYNNLALVHVELGQYEQARSLYERALAIRLKALGPEHPSLLATFNNLGEVMDELGQHEQARSLYERALALGQKKLGPEHPDLAYPLLGLGRALLHLGQREAAGSHLERALSLRKAAVGEQSPELAPALAGLAEWLLAMGRPTEALPRLEQALALAQGAQLAEVQWLLAQALRASSKEPQRALALATQAREYYQRLGHKRRLAHVSQWLTARSSP